MATERTITIETAHVERTRRYVILAYARDTDGAIVGAFTASAPSMATGAGPKPIDTHQTTGQAVQALAAWIIGELTP